MIDHAEAGDFRQDQRSFGERLASPGFRQRSIRATLAAFREQHIEGDKQIRHEVPWACRDQHHQRGEGRQPRGLRRDQQAAGKDRVGVGQILWLNKRDG
jgi:hypothetical protein